MEQGRPVARWPFIISAQLLESEALLSVIHNMVKNQGISVRVEELGMQHFQIKPQHRKFTPDPEFPKGKEEFRDRFTRSVVTGIHFALQEAFHTITVQTSESTQEFIL